MRFFIISFIVLCSSVTLHTYASELRMSPQQLLQELDTNKNLTIVDVRSKNDYDVGHIKNAINFPVELTYKNRRIDGQIQQPLKMQTFLQTLGITINSDIVVYDGNSLVDAARVFWTFEVYGLKKVKVLDHGFNYWLNKGFPASQQTPEIIPSKYIATINHQRLSSKFTTQLAIHNKNKIVIDARSYAAYKGETSVAKRFGHIPTAINVPFNHNIITNNDFSTLKPIEELKKLYKDIPLDKKVIIYCKIGRVSSTNYFALRELGHDVSNYDASWREWGNDESLPIEK